MVTVEQRQLYNQKIEASEARRDYVIDSVGVWGPLLVPLVPAGLTAISIGMHYTELLGIPWGASWAIGTITGVAIEVLGVISVETYLDMKTFNQALSNDADEAPEGWAGSVMTLYVGIVISLVVLLKMLPSMAILSLLPLTLLAVVTSWIVVLRKQHRKRVSKIEEAKARADRVLALSNTVDELRRSVDGYEATVQDLEAENGQLKADNEKLKRDIDNLKSGQRQAQKQDNGHGSKQDSRQRNMDILVEWLSTNPDSKKSDIANMFSDKGIDVSDKTIGRYLSDIGAIRDGHKWTMPEQEELTMPIFTNGHGAN